MSKYDFYYPQFKKFKISHILWDKFKKIEPKFYHKTSYYDKLIYWSLPDDMDAEEVEALLYIAFNNLRTDDNIIKEIGKTEKVWEHYIKLFNRAYFETDMELSSYNEVGLAFKRPFGNSYVIGDVADMMSNDKEFVKENPHILYANSDNCSIQYVGTTEVNPDKLDEKKFFDEFYSVMIKIIQNYNFEFTHFDVVDYRESYHEKYADIQLDNVYEVQSALLIPEIIEFRNELIDDLLKD